MLTLYLINGEVISEDDDVAVREMNNYVEVYDSNLGTKWHYPWSQVKFTVERDDDA